MTKFHVEEQLKQLEDERNGDEDQPVTYLKDLLGKERQNFEDQLKSAWFRMFDNRMKKSDNEWGPDWYKDA